MSVTSYERLRIAHRGLLKQPQTETELRNLLEALPNYLDSIASIRPALVDEVAASRQHVQHLLVRAAVSRQTERQQIVQSLYRALAPLFG
jgi:hypothetical protein